MPGIYRWPEPPNLKLRPASTIGFLDGTCWSKSYLDRYAFGVMLIMVSMRMICSEVTGVDAC